MRAINVTLFLIASSALLTVASGQTVYKCGHSYSQISCPDAVEINTQDPRTTAQKKAAERSAQAQVRQAKELETTRLKEEAAADKAAQAQNKQQEKKQGKERRHHKPRKAQPERPNYFTAQSPSDNAKKKKSPTTSATP